MSTIKLVEQFHEVFDHLIAAVPTLPDPHTLEFRTNFIKEELQELVEAVANNDLVGVADALGDIQYVLDGFFLNCGMHEKKDEILQAIHDSNMSKVCANQADAIKTIDWLEEQGVKAHFKKVGEHYIIKRTSDGKVMKPSGYKTPDLEPILQSTNTKTADPVNSPAHYTDGNIEVIDFIEDKKLGFCLGNTVKYVARAGKKDPSKTLEDLAKAQWYLIREMTKHQVSLPNDQYAETQT